MYVVHLKDFDYKKCIVWVGGRMPPVGVGFGMLVDFLGQKNYTIQVGMSMWGVQVVGEVLVWGLFSHSYCLHVDCTMPNLPILFQDDSKYMLHLSIKRSCNEYPLKVRGYPHDRPKVRGFLQMMLQCWKDLFQYFSTLKHIQAELIFPTILLNKTQPKQNWSGCTQSHHLQ